MKVVFTAVCSLLLTIGAFAQAGLVLTDTTAQSKTGELNGDGVAFYNLLINQSGQPTTVSWSRELTKPAANWYSEVCTNDNCFDSAVSSGKFQMGIGDTTILTIYIYDDAIVEGTGYVSLYLTDSITSQSLVMEADYTANEVSAIDDRPHATVQLFPNPASRVVQLHHDGMDIATVRVFDFAGRLVQEHAALSSTTSFSVASLSAGQYLVAALNHNGQSQFSQLLTVE